MKKVIILIFAFSISQNQTAPGQYLDALNIEQLNIKLDKAVKLRNVGIITIGTGVGITAVGCITTLIWIDKTIDKCDVCYFSILEYPLFYCVVLGIPIAAVGAILWINGGNRKSKAEIALKKFN